MPRSTEDRNCIPAPGDDTWMGKHECIL